MKIKKYGAFISSHYRSLKKIRGQFIHCLMDAQLIPMGMEHFTATSSENFGYIKNLIDQSDIFILILGKTYGSCDENGVSWTEREYLYAKEKKKLIFAFKTKKYIALEKKKGLFKALLSSDGKKQLAFGASVDFAQTITDFASIQRSVTQISSENLNGLAGWERWNERKLETWRKNNNAFDLRGKWFHVHMKDSNDETEESTKYLRIGTLNVKQEFDPENYKRLSFQATNFNILHYDTAKGALESDDSKKTVWNGDYAMNVNTRTIFGAYKTQRFFKAEYGDWKVEKGNYMGIHEMTLDDPDNDNDASDDTLSFSGNFNDVNPSPKRGMAYFFRTAKARDEFVMKKFGKYLEKV